MDGTQLEHVLELPFGCLEAVWGQASRMGGDWRACGLDVVNDIVLDRRMCGRDLSEVRKLGQQIEVGVGAILGVERRTGRGSGRENTLYV